MNIVYKSKQLKVELNKLDNDKFFLFLKKFKGTLNFRGKKSNSIKRIDKVFLILKKSKKLFSAFFIIYYAVLNLITLINKTKIKISGRLLDVPQIATNNKQMINIIEWVVKQQRLKSYMRGYNLNQIAKAFMDSFDKEEYKSVIDKKNKYVYEALRGGKFSIKFFNKYYGFLKNFEYYDFLHDFYYIKKSGNLGLSKKINFKFAKNLKFQIKKK
jgi:hypothetical protein